MTPVTSVTPVTAVTTVVSPVGRVTGWRWWRGPVILAAVIVLGGAVIAMLQPGPASSQPLDPRNVGPSGTHALAAVLAGQGEPVSRVDTVAAAVAQARQPHAALVVADPSQIPPASLSLIAASPADLLVIAPGRAALAALAPGVSLAAQAPVTSHQPRCGWPGARLAGSADTGGLLLSSDVTGSWQCYPALSATRHPAGGRRTGRYASLIRYRSGGRTISVLGTGAPLTNASLGQDGNAALALNLLAGDAHIVWLVPGPVIIAGPARQSVSGLIPRPAYLVLAQLAVAVVLAALWRMRRFGPLVFEPLPVVVRASETVEGHGRLYRSRRARDRAAAALRAATVATVIARTGLPQAASPEAICTEVAGRAGRAGSEVRAMLFGPVPADDAALVTLAADLDALEGQVLSQ